MNTKYINGQFVRNVATVLVAAVVGAFWACSNDESTLGGGVSEETRVTALNDITIAGRAMAYVDASVSEIDSAGYRLESEEFTYKDARVTVSELDSTTFEKTGVEFIGFVYDKDGSFKLDSVSFKSPYVLVRVEELARNLPSVNAVVDLRTTKNINLSVMTTLVCKRVLSLAATGIGLDSAKREAEREALEAFYIYEKLSSFDDLTFESEDDKSYYIFVMMNLFFGDWKLGFGLEMLAEDIALDGLWNDNPAFDSEHPMSEVFWGITLVTTKEMYDSYVKTPLKKRILLAARDLADDPDAVELKKYLGNFYARAGYSLESCEESNQGKVYVEELWPVVCDKGSWMFDDEMPHEMGTMVNSRDGKVYKTTTFELNGVKQTWMAENLNYSDSLQGDSWCYDNDPKNCETYGRLYSWNAAMNTREPLDYESLRCAEEDVDFYNHEDEIADSLLDSQGICPDGWRLPTKEDWSVILTDRSSMFNLESYRRCAYIRSKSWTSELFILASSDM